MNVWNKVLLSYEANVGTVRSFGLPKNDLEYLFGDGLGYVE